MSKNLEEVCGGVRYAKSPSSEDEGASLYCSLSKNIGGERVPNCPYLMERKSYSGMNGCNYWEAGSPILCSGNPEAFHTLAVETETLYSLRKKARLADSPKERETIDESWEDLFQNYIQRHQIDRRTGQANQNKFYHKK